jgi:hypothetical protein
MRRKQILKSGDEYDAVSLWRRVLRWKAGQRKAIKRRLNRRFRRQAWAEARMYDELD